MTEDPRIKGTETFYGVPVATLGEDDCRVITFTHDLRRATAAARRYIRWREGERVTALHPTRPLWTQVFDHCGCPPHEPDAKHGHADCDCEYRGVPPCSSDFAWMSVWCDEGAPGALPIIEFEWEC